MLFLASTLYGQRQDIAGAVYTMTNAVGGNEILVFDRGADGRVTPAGSYGTGGLGAGAGLGNQGGLVLSDDDRWLLVVNAGSNSVSVFAVSREGLHLTDTEPSGGTTPISVTIHKDLVYVLNAGVPNNIRGFRLSTHGVLTPLPSPALPLSGVATGPAQISFSPNGDSLIVTEKATSLIDVYPVSKDGSAAGPIPFASNGATPFGFAFGKRDQVFVSEAFGGALDASAVSSYELSSTGTLLTVSPSVPTTETAACWAVVTNDGRFVYTTNANSGSISGYEIGFDGSLTLLNADGRTAETGAGSAPLDMATSRNSRYLYVLNSGSGTVGIWSIGADGSLTSLGAVGGLPPTANGIAAR
jgi:6-phosphogluconolactonase (cycloisomerase 2 family)